MSKINITRRDYGQIQEIGDAIWNHKNPESKMETPNMIYEQVEKYWDEWRKFNTPFVQFVEDKIGFHK